MHKTMLVAFGALSLAGCMTSQSHESSTSQSAVQPGTATQPGTGDSEMSAMCPLAVPGTTVREEDVPGGGALVFTTTQGDVMDLRRRVAQMADMHNRHLAMHEEMEQQGTGGAGAGMGQGMKEGAPNAPARAEDVEGGARIVYTPKDPAQVAVLRQQLVHHASMMTSGNCPMMMMHRQGMQEQPQP